MTPTYDHRAPCSSAALNGGPMDWCRTHDRHAFGCVGALENRIGVLEDKLAESRARVTELDDQRQRQRNFEERQEDIIKELRTTIARLRRWGR